MKEKALKNKSEENLSSTISEAVAIIGMSCRFPMAPNLEAFWDLLQSGRDTIREIPMERWNYGDYYDKDSNARNKTNQRHASMLEKIHDFDPLFFSISPAEAAEMSPSQKLMLELVWESIENSRMPLTNIQNKGVGVYIGNIWNDFEHHRKHKNALVTSHSAIGQSSNIIANRISYAFGFTGPSLVVDTGCSSSLVALHLACQSLRDGSSEMAVVAGINHILDPDQYILLSKFGGLSSTGKCSAFDANADGFVRGEGGGVVLLKKLSDAERDGDLIHAVIRGSAINNNGSNVSLPTTSVSGQKQMLAEAYKLSGIAPHEVHYVEAHGTGTKLGDPTEARAIGEFFGEGRKENKLRIGSVKTNIGHLEAAAGIAGLIKVVLAMKNRKIPSSLNYKTPNPSIPFDELKLVVQDKIGEWPSLDKETLKAGVNSFGWGGTNAHTVIEEYSLKKPAARPLRRSEIRFCLPISARSIPALKDYAKTYRDLFQSGSESSFQDLVITSAILKPALDLRLLFSANRKEDMIASLDDFIQAPDDINVHSFLPDNKIVMVFPGQGSQWPGMGKELFEREPVFRTSIDECDEAFKSYTDWSLIEQLFASPENSLMERIDVIQPVIFAIQISLARLWMSWGIKPHAVVGHSMGEVAAAFISGALSLDHAARIICTRSRLMRTVSGKGGTMATTALSMEEAQRLIERYPELSIAANNSPRSTVLSGDQLAINNVLIELERQDIFCRQVKVDVASHSHQMDPLKDKLREDLNEIDATPNDVPLYSTVYGDVVDAVNLSADYWVNNLRGTVQFRAAIDKLLKTGHTTFIEISPHPILVNAVNECIQENGATAHVITSTNKSKPEQDTIYQNLGELYSRGIDLDWKRFYGVTKAPDVDLPSYPFQRTRYELETIPNAATHKPNSRLIGDAMYVADSETCTWESTLSLADFPYLRDHRVNEEIVLPGALYVEMALEAAHELFNTGKPVVSHLVFLKSISVTENDAVTIQLKLQQQNRRSTIEFFAKTIKKDKKPTWELLAKCELKMDRSQHGITALSSFSAQTSFKTASSFYESLTSLGLNYGPYFQNISHISENEHHEETLYVTVRAGESVSSTSSKYKIHPALLDSIFQPLFFRLANIGTDEGQYTSFLTDIGELTYYGAIDYNDELRCVVRLKQPKKDERRGFTITEADIDIYKSDDTAVLKVRGLKGKIIDTAFIMHRNEKLKNWLYSVQWIKSEKKSFERNSDPSHWVVFGDPYGVSGILVERIKMVGIGCIHVIPGAAFAKVSSHEYTIRYGNDDDYNKLIHDLFIEGKENIKGILHAGSMSYTWQDPYLTADRVEEQQVYGSISFMYLHQQLAKLNLEKLPKLIILTNGIQAVGHGHHIAQPVHSPLWGMVKVMFNELTQYQCRYFDLSANPIIEELDQVVDEIQHDDPEENEVALRGNDQFVPRLGVLASTAPTNQVTQFSPHGTYVVTGYRGLGFVFIEWMIRQGARNFALISRTGDVGNEVLERMAVLESQGYKFGRFKADTGNYSELKNTLELIESSMTEISGVVHAAGVIEARRLVELDPEEFLRILNPKVKGAWNLHLLTQHKQLDCFILFSSASTLIGLSGQGSYVAANAFLDTLAHTRRQMGLAGMSVNWGVIKDVGMVADKAELERYARAEGFEPVTMQDAMEVFNLIYEAQYTQIGIMKLDPKTMATYYSALSQTRYFKGLLRKEESAIKQHNNFTDIFSALPSHEERMSALEQLVIRLVADVAKTPATHIKTGMTFQKLGFDSLMAVQLWNQFEMSTGLKLPLSVFWKHPVIQNCVMFMCTLLEEKLQLRNATPGFTTDKKSLVIDKPDWFVIPHPTPEASSRIFCFHDAGGNTSLYHKWKDHFDDVEMILIELPGRYNRSDEKPYADVSLLIADLLPAIIPMTDKPFSFFGHSMGGLIAFELTRALRKANRAMPSKIFISSTPELTTYSRRDVDHTLSDVELIELFPNLGNGNIDDTLRQTLTALLRADLLLLNNYRYEKLSPIPVDLIVIHGEDDDRVTRQQAEQWEHETTSSFKVITRPGGHRYLELDTEFLTALIREELFSMKTMPEYERVS
jgi:acyl transferase domain-containing protein/surfactin synthase thioesterase subunit/acyl carrier protein